MDKSILRFLLRTTTSPLKVYNVVSRLSYKVLPTSIPLNCVEERDKFEKIILLSASILDFNPNKDMQSDFIKAYINQISSHIFVDFQLDHLCETFESMSIGGVFDWQYGVNPTNKENEVKSVLREYVTDRLALYRLLLIEIHNSSPKGLFELTAFIGDYGFCPMTFLTDREHLDCYELPEHVIKIQSNFETATKLLLNGYFNLVKVPTKTQLTANPESERFHTEQNLAFLQVPEDGQYISFERISGVGSIECQDCRKTIDEVVAFIHGSFSADIGRQCPKCGHFCSEHNESKEYHQFGPSNEDFYCPKCHYPIRHKDESIFKGNANPLFCPYCNSTKLRYRTRFLS